MANLNTIKNWFKTGFKPTQQQFWDTWDSFWHKDEKIPLGAFENIEERFNQKADDQLLRAHLKDLQAHGLQNKVDKEAGKGLSSNDFTNQEKAKLKELQNTPKDNTVGEQINAKVALLTLSGVNNYSGDLNPPLNAYNELQLLVVRFINANTEVNPTLNINAKGALNLVKGAGAQLAVKDIADNSLHLIVLRPSENKACILTIAEKLPPSGTGNETGKTFLDLYLPDIDDSEGVKNVIQLNEAYPNALIKQRALGVNFEYIKTRNNKWKYIPLTSTNLFTPIPPTENANDI